MDSHRSQPPLASSASENEAGSIPPEAIELAGRMYNAAREGNKAIFEQALPAGLPANLTNEKGDTLVCHSVSCILDQRADGNAARPQSSCSPRITATPTSLSS